MVDVNELPLPVPAGPSSTVYRCPHCEVYGVNAPACPHCGRATDPGPTSTYPGLCMDDFFDIVRHRAGVPDD